MKSISLVVAALVAMSPLSFAVGKPITVHPSIWEVIFNSGEKKVVLVQGYNALNQPISVECGSGAGCLVSASSTAQTNAAGATYLCTFIDGVQAKPACGKVADGNDVVNLRQYATVNQGVHKIQTFLAYGIARASGDAQAPISVPDPATLLAWETEYTIYARK